MSGKQGATPGGSAEGGRPGQSHASVASIPTFLVLVPALFVSLLLVGCGLTDTDWAAPTAAHTADLTYSAPSPAAGELSSSMDAKAPLVIIESASEQVAPELVLNESLTAQNTDPTVVVKTVTSTIAGTARIVGFVSPALDVDVTVGGPGKADMSRRVRPDSNGAFDLDVGDLVSGPQTVCLNSDCHRVFIAEETHESHDVIHRRILDALVHANQIFDFETALPEWTVMVAGPSTGAGGHFDPIHKVISISGTSGRTTEEFVTTILHEVGHAMEFEYLSDADRSAYRSMRGINADGAWMPRDLLAHERWESPAEDFAEVFVTWLTNGSHQTRSSVADQPTSDQMQTFAAMVSDWS